MEIDVRRDQAAQAAAAEVADRSRPGRRGEEAVDHRTQRLRLRGVGAPGVTRRPARGVEEGAVDRAPAARERRAVEEAVLVERRRQRLDLLGGDQLALAPHDLRLDVDDRMLAVEECDDPKEPDRKHDDRGGVARRIAQRDVALALVLDRKGLDRPQARRGRSAHGSRKFRADAT